MTPTTLRFAVLASRYSLIWRSFSAMIGSGAPCAWSTEASWANLVGRVAAGASGISTGSNVTSSTSNATWGFQNQAVAYQGPSTVVDRSPSARLGGPTRSNSLLVARTMNTRP